MKYSVIKTFDHSLGLSCCFRQWRAIHSHCSRIHGYALSVKLVFEAEELNADNWVIDFGGLKEIKEYLVDTFDHTMLIAQDDPHIATFRRMAEQGLIKPVIVDAVGCERFAEMIFKHVNTWLLKEDGRVKIKMVVVSEHNGNSAAYGVDHVE